LYQYLAAPNAPRDQARCAPGQHVASARKGGTVPKQVTNVASDDALTTIYRIAHDEEGEVIAARVADRLGLRAASVAGMLARLRRDQLVEVDERKHISLTEAGHARAEQMVRRHRLAECLLVETLGLEWWRAYEEAHLMEHAISDVTEPLIVERLGQPRVSPFGYPIPGVADARAPSRRRVTSLTAGTEAIIDRVFEEEEELLRFFDAEGIRPGVRIEVREVAAYKGTVTIALDDHELVMGTGAAHHIWVQE
jgi:DtxR family transcriptional regulator, Mn-dependent transcriptional regulator